MTNFGCKRSAATPAWLLVGLVLVAACAEGFAIEEAYDTLLQAQQSDVGIDPGGAPPGDTGATGDDSQTMTMSMMGDGTGTSSGCALGAIEMCTCEDGVEGQKNCLSSGEFGPCRCEDPPPGDVMADGAGMTGSSGSDGGGSGTGSGGSAGLSSSAGLSGGSRGNSNQASTNTNPVCNPPCTQLCFPIGILPCCAAGGRCGCSWAPGAYCL